MRICEWTMASKIPVFPHTMEGAEMTSPTSEGDDPHKPAHNEELRRIAVDNYVRSCRLFDVKIDPSVVISLMSGWEIIQPTTSFG